MKHVARTVSTVSLLFVVAAELFQMIEKGARGLNVAIVVFASLALVLALIAWGHESRGTH